MSTSIIYIIHLLPSLFICTTKALIYSGHYCLQNELADMTSLNTMISMRVGLYIRLGYIANR